MHKKLQHSRFDIRNSSLPSFCLTVDVEDWFQVENLRPWNPPASWEQRELRLERSMNAILDLLDECESVSGKACSATFFILGWVAERLPEMVREIRNRGHEVASHGYNHNLCLNEEKHILSQDLARSRKLLEDITGMQVKGYRAPGFSIDHAVLEQIRGAGYLYDSSYNSFAPNKRYGQIDLSGCPHKGRVFKIGNGFFEIPISNLNLGRRVLPWGGGGYFRLYPLPVFLAGVRNIIRKDKAYVFYAHPWEFDPDQPKVKEAPFLSRIRHYLNLDKSLIRLRSLLQQLDQVRFVSCAEYLAACFPERER